MGKYVAKFLSLVMYRRFFICEPYLHGFLISTIIKNVLHFVPTLVLWTIMTSGWED